MATRHLAYTCVSILLSLALVVSAAPAARAYQVDFIDFEIDDGNFVGTVAISGGFVIDVSQFDERVSGFMDVWIDANGPATATVVDGVVDGDWSMSGPGGFDGFFTSQGFTLNMEGTTDYLATGAFSGSSTAARINGTIDSTTTATISSPAGGSSATSSATDQFDEALTDVLAGCSQIVARFDRRLSADIEAQLPGASVDVQGLIALYRDEELDDETRRKVESITQRAAELDTGSGEPFVDLADALALLRDVEDLQDELAGDQQCAPGKEFFNTLTLTAGRVALRALDALDALSAAEANQADADSDISLLLPEIVRLTLATGADGGGATAPNGALARAETMAEGAWNRTIDTSGEIDIGTLGRLSAMAVQNGWEFVSSNGVTVEDIDLVLGD